MSLTTWVTRGGQLALHRFRMVSQVLSLLISIGLCGGVGYGVWSAYHTIPATTWQSAQTTWMAHFLLTTSLGNSHDVTQEIQEGPHRRTVRSIDVLHHSRLVRHTRWVEATLLKSLWQGIWMFFWIAGLGLTFFLARGFWQSRKVTTRGKALMSPRRLAWKVRLSGQASDLTLDGLPLLKHKETQHMLLTGTTGSGKSNALNTLLPQIRRRPNRALVVDLTGDLVNRFYRPDQDLLLNPFEARSEAWSPWEECSQDFHYDMLAQAIVPPSLSHTDPFWQQAGKELLAAALRKMEKEKDIEKLYTLLVKAPLKDFCAAFHTTEAAAYTHPDGEKMTLSIRATLANHLQSFKSLQKGTFSLRAWVTQERPSDQWLFLTATPDQRATLVPLIRGQVDTALNALMTLAPCPNRRLWVVLDELPALQKLPSLTPLLAEGRKYGACVLAGFQSFPQLTEAYGPHTSQTLLDLFNTKLFFRSDHPATTQWMSQVLGEKEVKSFQENVSYGANTMRDGVSLSRHTKRVPLVLPTEITALKDLEGYLKLPGHWPITKLKMRYKKGRAR